jgi:hypothetical protein
MTLRAAHAAMDVAWEAFWVSRDATEWPALLDAYQATVLAWAAARQERRERLWAVLGIEDGLWRTGRRASARSATR